MRYDQADASFISLLIVRLWVTSIHVSRQNTRRSKHHACGRLLALQLRVSDLVTGSDLSRRVFLAVAPCLQPTSLPAVGETPEPEHPRNLRTRDVAASSAGDVLTSRHPSSAGYQSGRARTGSQTHTTPHRSLCHRSKLEFGIAQFQTWLILLRDRLCWSRRPPHPIRQFTLQMLRFFWLGFLEPENVRWGSLHPWLYVAGTLTSVRSSKNGQGSPHMTICLLTESLRIARRRPE